MDAESLRPNPDELLAQIKNEEQQNRGGRLKIFLGYVAGVGKTYAMLEAAGQRKAEGMDVVAAYVETHDRLETGRLLSGLEQVPNRKVSYRGIELQEMDVDAVLARRPQLALVDELAHTNAPGSRHPKRYQDVEELIEAGIHVYTTLNIQHLESLNDVVAQITGVTMQETVPDRLLDEAAEIELVDLPPDELLQRLKEGKVYVPDQAGLAMEKFFRKGNLTALRELAMRRAAQRIDTQMQAYMQTRAIPGPWPAVERLLVCISPSPIAEHLVRSGRRLADELKADWLAVFVETPEYIHISQEKRDRVTRALELAEALGGRSIVLTGTSLAPTIASYARRHNITKIVIGRPLRPQISEILRGSSVDQLIRQIGNIDLHIINSEIEPAPLAQMVSIQRHSSWYRYLLAAFSVVVAGVLASLFHGRVSPTNLAMLFLLAVVFSAAYLGRGPSILASFLSVLTFDFFFVPPYMTLRVSDTEYLLTFAGLLGVGLFISTLTARVRAQAEAAEKREIDTATLYGLSRDLAVARGVSAILNALTLHVSQTFNSQVVLFLPEMDGKNATKASILQALGSDESFGLDDNERAIAIWAFEHGQHAGHGTETLTASEITYIPLRTAQGVVGVLGVKPEDRRNQLLPEQRRLLEAFANQAAQAIERVRLSERASQMQVMQETEKLQTALLNSISHDLRTPLVTVTGALSTLKEKEAPLGGDARIALAENAYQEADRLNRMVGNLLNMTRLEAGTVKVIKHPSDVQDAIGSALEQLRESLEDRPVNVEVPLDMPLIPMDFVLVVQVLVNLIDNAVKYSPDGSPIDIHARLSGAFLEIQVADRGVGIPQEDLQRVFDKFYRVQRPENVSGTGLGLSICKGIAEAHGGFIGAENRPGGGTLVTLALPVDEILEVNPDLKAPVP
ncbi:MAG: DUF4118 domain-containing protein [Omnitrophica WOR_2 bacterium]